MATSGLEQLTNENLGRFTAILAAAFLDDPVMLWVCGNERCIGPAFMELAKHLYVKKGFGHITPEGEGATLWLPPGETKDVSLIATLSMGLAMLRYGGVKAPLNGLRIDAALLKAKPVAPHYYLFAIGVRPECQGRGFGKMLTAPVLAQCDQEGMPAYLESSKEENIPIYRTMGFEVTDTIDPGHGCPPLYPMWREPK